MLTARAALQDGTLLSLLPEAKVASLTMNLGAPDEAMLRIPVAAGRQLQIAHGSEVHVYADGDPVPLLMGIPWTARSSSAGLLEVPVASVESMFLRRFVRSTLAYTAVEQFQIGWNLIDHTQNQPGGDLGITAAAWTPSGVTRDRTYQPYNMPVIAEELDAFRDIIDGFDWTVLPTAANAREWTPYYPQRGSALDVQVGYGPNTRGNAVAYTGYQTLDGPVTRGFVGGAGSGPDRLIGSYADPGLGTTSKLVEGFRSGSSSMTDQQTADDYAQNLVECSTAPLTVVESVDVHGPSTFVRSVRPGDTLPVRINHGWFQADATYRVRQCKWPATFDRVGLALEPA